MKIIVLKYIYIAFPNQLLNLEAQITSIISETIKQRKQISLTTLGDTRGVQDKFE